VEKQGEREDTNTVVGKCHFACYGVLADLGFCSKSALDFDELHSWNK